MKISLNNRDESFPHDKLSISEILELKNYTFKMMVIKINGKLIKKTERNTAQVTDGDDVQILHMISGG